MAYEIPGDVRTVEAVGDLSGSYLKFVKFAGATLVAVNNAGDAAYGVLQNKPNKPSDSGVFKGAERSAASVMINGISRVVAAKALAAGVAVYLSADGSVTDVVNAGHCVGQTVTAASGAGKLCSIEIKPLGSVGAEA